jgi:hypothetical protein
VDRPNQHECHLAAPARRRPSRPRQDPQRAKVEILKHLDGDLVIVPRPSTTGERRAEICGRAKADRTSDLFTLPPKLAGGR